MGYTARVQTLTLASRWAGLLCLGLAALTVASLLWPSPRTRIELHVPGDLIQSGWISGSSVRAADSWNTPSLNLAIELPARLLLGREERCTLVVDLPAGLPSPSVYSVSADVRSRQAEVTPPGEMGQALRSGMRYEWTLLPRSVPTVSATLLVRLRRHAGEGPAEAERLVLARDLTLPVRTVAGLSAPLARVGAAVLGGLGALLGVAAARTRAR